jgi:predicted secreted protein
MHNVTLAFEAIWKVLLVGLVLGAGLPALFAAGIRFGAWGQGGEAEAHAAGAAVTAPHRLGRALAAVCFAVVLAAVALGILYIVVTGMGNKLSFEHVYPTIKTT